MFILVYFLLCSDCLLFQWLWRQKPWLPPAPPPSSAAAAAAATLTMGRTPHRGTNSLLFSGYLLPSLIFAFTVLIWSHRTTCIKIFFFCKILFSSNSFSRMLHAFIHTLITVCISDAPKPWWAFQSSFDFRSKRGERETEQHHSRLCPRQIQWLATLISNAFPFIFDAFIDDLFELIACLIQLLLCEFSYGVNQQPVWICIAWHSRYRLYCTLFTVLHTVLFCFWRF